MKTRLRLDMLPQPDDSTCGPTCLHAVYRYLQDNIGLSEVIGEISTLSTGGTLAVILACHALRRGYDATIYTYNLQVFDPTWFTGDPAVIQQGLARQAKVKTDPKLQWATQGYLEFLERGGKLRYEDLTASLLRKHLKSGLPILTGLSSTYLYRSPRETHACEPNDVAGLPSGHFVVVCGYDQTTQHVLIADPYLPNPVAAGHYYEVHIDRLVCAILLGILTYDANFLVIAPKRAEHTRSFPLDRRG